jgi:hypothetical protein
MHVSPRNSINRRTSRCIKLPRHPPRQKRLSPSLNRLAHGPRHQHRVFRPRDRRIEQHRVKAHLHCQRRIARSAQPRIHNQWNLRYQLAHHPQRAHICNANPSPNWRTQRHHRSRPRINQPFRKNNVIRRIRQNTSTRVASSVACTSGYSVATSPITSIFTQSESPTSRPSRAARIASSAV